MEQKDLSPKNLCFAFADLLTNILLQCQQVLFSLTRCGVKFAYFGIDVAVFDVPPRNKNAASILDKVGRPSGDSRGDGQAQNHPGTFVF